MVGSHEHGDEPSNIMKVRTFLKELSNYRLLKMDLDAWSFSGTSLRVCHTMSSHTLQKKKFLKKVLDRDRLVAKQCAGNIPLLKHHL